MLPVLPQKRLADMQASVLGIKDSIYKYSSQQSSQKHAFIISQSILQESFLLQIDQVSTQVETGDDGLADQKKL